MSRDLTPHARLVIAAGLLLRAARLCESVKPAITWSERPNPTAEEIGRLTGIKPGELLPNGRPWKTTRTVGALDEAERCACCRPYLAVLSTYGDDTHFSLVKHCESLVRRFLRALPEEQDRFPAGVARAVDRAGVADESMRRLLLACARPRYADPAEMAVACDWMQQQGILVLPAHLGVREAI